MNDPLSNLQKHVNIRIWKKQLRKTSKTGKKELETIPLSQTKITCQIQEKTFCIAMELISKKHVCCYYSLLL